MKCGQESVRVPWVSILVAPNPVAQATEHGCRSFVRPVDSKLPALPLKPRESVLGRAFLSL